MLKGRKAGALALATAGVLAGAALASAGGAASAQTRMPPRAKVAGASITGIFLSIPGITGETTSYKYKGDIEVSAIQRNETNNASGVDSGAGAGAGKVRFTPLGLALSVDAAYPQLLQAMYTGKRFDNVTLTTVTANPDTKQGGPVTEVTTLGKVLVSNVAETESRGSAGQVGLLLSYGEATTTVTGPDGKSYTAKFSTIKNSSSF